METDDYAKAVGQRLALIREARGFTQAFLGSQIHVTQSTIANWETQGRLITSRSIQKLCLTLGCSPDYLLTGNLASLPMELVTAITAIRDREDRDRKPQQPASEIPRRS